MGIIPVWYALFLRFFMSQDQFLFMAFIRFSSASTSGCVSPERSNSCFRSIPSRKSVVTLKILAIWIRTSYDGSRRPVSYALMTDFVSWSFCASCACVRSSLRRNVFSVFPKSTIRIPPAAIMIL